MNSQFFRFLGFNITPALLDTLFQYLAKETQFMPEPIGLVIGHAGLNAHVVKLDANCFISD
jgi:hypothetical protein